MKTKIKTITAFAVAVSLVGFAAGIQAQEKDHDHNKIEAGPNGGRVLKSVEPHLEFFVTKDRKVQITALGEDGKAIPIEKQVVKVTGGDRANPTRMKFEKEGDVLISTIVFPEGNDFPVVVQLKKNKVSKTILEKFNLNLNQCPTCDFAEYACACDHSHEGHDHKEDEHKGHKH